MEVLTKKITYKDFAEMEFPDDDNFIYELLNGELVRKNAPSGEHQFTQSKLFTLLSRFVDDHKKGMVFASPTALILSDTDAPQPDLMFLSSKNMNLFDPEWGIRGTPDMVVEIVSPTSYKRDHFDKKLLYQTYQIPEYWIIDPAYRSVEIFVLEKKEYKLHAFGVDQETVSSTIIEGFSIEVNGIFHKKEG